MACNSYWSAYSLTEINFTNTSYEEKHTLDFTAPAQGDYLILITFKASISSTSDIIYVRAQLDNSTTILEMAHAPTNASGSYHFPSFGTVYLAESLSSGAHYVDIDAYSGGGTSASMESQIILVLRLDDWLTTSGMYDYSATEAETSLNTTYADLATLTFTPDTGGDYLVLASCEHHSGSASYSSVIRLDYDSASEYLPIQTNSHTYEHNTYERQGSSYHADVWGGIVNIPASEKTIKLQGAVSSGSYGAARKRRIFAVRLGAMSSSPQSNEDTSETLVEGDTMTSKATKTWTPSAQVDHLIIGSILLRPPSTSQEGQCQLNHSAGTNPAVIHHSRTDCKDYGGPADYFPFFFCYIKELGATSQTISVQFCGRASNDDQYGKGGFLLIADIGEAAAGQIDTLNSISWNNVDAFMGIEDTNIDDVMGIDSGE